MRTRTARLLSLIPTALLVAVTLGGCADDQAKRRAALLEQEANELRARNEQLEAALSASNDERARLESEMLRAERDALAAAQQPRGAETGFEGIEGVGSTRGPGGEVIVDIVGDVLFDSGKVTLKNTAKQTLDRVAGVINSSYSGRTIRVEGHTDSDPIRKSQWKTNERLSAERALAVEEYLVSKGVDKSRMYIAGFADARPRGSKAQSRRVEIVILAN